MTNRQRIVHLGILFVNLIASAWLGWIMWRHAHSSVAFSVTLLLVNNDFQGYLKRVREAEEQAYGKAMEKMADRIRGAR